MLRWRNEIELNSRYAITGVFNSLVGLATIWSLTKLGAVPIVANFLGYAVALSIGFLGARRFVFRSEGRFTAEAIRYLGSFAVCYLINAGALLLCISQYSIDPIIGQGIAVCCYVISMYMASRLFVFSRKHLD